MKLSEHKPVLFLSCAAMTVASIAILSSGMVSGRFAALVLVAVFFVVMMLLDVST